MSADNLRPGEVPFTPLARLAEWFIGHASRVVDAQHGRGDLLPDQVRDHAVSALRLQRQILDEASVGRWVLVAEALARGARPGDVARATGLPEDELRAELAEWANRQCAAGWITVDEYDQVLKLATAGVDR